MKQRWPNVPHQVCQFHALREASRPAFEADRAVKTALRKHIQRKIKAVRKQLKEQIPAAPPAEAAQLAVVDDYALGVLTAINVDGTLPFDYPAVAAGQALDEVATSLQRLEKRGEQ